MSVCSMLTSLIADLLFDTMETFACILLIMGSFSPDILKVHNHKFLPPNYWSNACCAMGKSQKHMGRGIHY